MDIESLEAANQSLQEDLKLAFKRIGDLQAAIEDEMESDDNDDLINRYNRFYMFINVWNLLWISVDFSVLVQTIIRFHTGI